MMPLAFCLLRANIVIVSLFDNVLNTIFDVYLFHLSYDYFDKIEVVNRLKKELAFETIKNYTINYDRTWIFDKIQ